MASAPSRVVKSLDKVKGISLAGDVSERELTLRLLRASLPVASELALKAAISGGFGPVSIAAMSAIQTVTALFAAASPRCNLAVPAEDIDPKVDNNGNLIYRCRHSPAHEWDFSGKKIP